MARPDAVPECVKKLSSTTFVAEVTGPALAVMVPLLVRALNERSQTVQRQTVIVVDNLCKLVRDPHEASKFLPALTPGVERVEKGASFPEVRDHAKAALTTLNKATAAVGDSKAEEDPKKVFAQAKSVASDNIIAAIQPYVPEEHKDVKSDKWALKGIDYLSSLIVRLADKRVVQASAWDDVYVLPYLRRLASTPENAQLATDNLRNTYTELDKVRFGGDEDDDEEIEGECLCKTDFSLAYGGLLLLNHTRLRLHRGHRYGIVAANGSGKSTLLKAMRDGKVEGYPPPDQVKTIMVEHSLQGEDASLPILEFVAADKRFTHLPKEEVRKALLEVGFDDERQSNPVGSLSGGWKMKLELARAMLIGADVLLLDEPTNHLDVGSVAWLEQYLGKLRKAKVEDSYLNRLWSPISHAYIHLFLHLSHSFKQPDHCPYCLSRLWFPRQRLYRHHSLRTEEAQILQRKPFRFRSYETRSQILLLISSNHSEIHFPTSRISYGSQIKHSYDFEVDGLHSDLSRNEETISIKRFSCSFPFFKSWSLGSKWCRKIYFD